MDVQFTPAQKAFLRDAIQSGRLQREEDAVKEALSLWEERERRRLEILLKVQEAEHSLARGEGRRVTTPEQGRALVEDVKRRGLARLNLDPSTAGLAMRTWVPACAAFQQASISSSIASKKTMSC